MALLATAYEQPVEAYVLGKMRRACDLWNEGDKALAHIHLAHAGLPPCDTDLALRLFVAEELIEAGVAPQALMMAQGLDPGPLDLLKAHFNPDQPRVPAGSGRDSGEWTDGEANFTPVAFRPRGERRGHRGGGRTNPFKPVWDLLDELLNPKDSKPPPEEKPANPEVVKPETKPLEPPEAENLQLPEVDANKLHHIFDDPGHGLDGLVAEFGSQESAFQAVASATRDAVKAQGISGQYEIQVEVGGHLVTVTGWVYNGLLKIGTVYIPWIP